ncbi:hypothetical protein QBC43DRAFT_302785 [Cladorrhinum sp. PSN259]|nr:hypothetical protein QBC43DRAFT_302785 [Cladorrhinum sp. PSN259]
MTSRKHQYRSRSAWGLQYKAWGSARVNRKALTVPGAMIQNPKITFQLPSVVQSVLEQHGDSSPCSHASCAPDANAKRPPAEGFILTGSIPLFGNDAWHAELYSHYGPLPSNSDQPVDQNVIYQMAVLKTDLHVSSLMPNFKETPLDGVELKDISFTYQNLSLDKTNIVRLTLSARIDFTPSAGEIHDVLSKVLAFNEPSLRVSCGLPGRQVNDWRGPLKIDSFRLTGVFTDNKPKPLCQNKLRLSRVGASLIGYKLLDFGNDNKVVRDRAYGYELFGTLHLDMPKCAAPLDMEFTIAKMGGTVTLSAAMDADSAWESAFGVPNLVLHDVALSVGFDLSAPLDTLVFEIQASLDVGPVVVSFSGYYSTSGDFGVVGYIENLGLEGLKDLYLNLFGQELDLPDVDISIHDCSIAIDRDAGFTLTVHNLKVGDHAAFGGQVKLGTSGLFLKATVDGESLVIHDVDIKKASLEVELNSACSGSKASVMIRGEALWHGHDLEVGVHLYQNPEPDARGLEYTCVGTFKAASSTGGFSLADLVPALRDTFMKDISLERITLVAASRADAQFGPLKTGAFPIRKGVHVCAILGEIEQFTTMSGGKHDENLILMAGWTPNQGLGLEIDILFSSDKTLHLGRGIVTDPIELKLLLKGDPELVITGGAKIPVQGQAEPLHFMLNLKLDDLRASATGHLATKGGWKNPFGICKDLVLGPDLALSIDILYETFLITGPCGFGFVGGAAVGKKQAQLAFQVDEIPSKELLSAKLENLCIVDAIAFTNEVFELQIPQLPDVLEFKQLDVYICPAGTSIGNLIYPPGFSFSSKLVLFGIQMDLVVSAGPAGLKANGSIDNFTLGPGPILAVRGVNGPKATFEFEMSSSSQCGKIDGLIDFLGVGGISIAAHFSLHPKLTFQLCFQLSFADLFNFEVLAYPIEGPNATRAGMLDVTTTDFRIQVEFHSELRGHISGQLNSLFDKKAREEEREAEVAKAKVEAKRQKYKADLDAKQAELDVAYACWQDKANKGQKEHDRIVAAEQAKVAAFQKRLDDKQAKMKADISDAHAKLAAAKADRSAKLKEKQDSLEAIRAHWDAEIDHAHHNLDEATRRLHDSFGDAEAHIEDARYKVNSVQYEIDQVNHHIDRLEDASCWDLPAKAELAEKYVERAALWGAKEIADDILLAAGRVLEAGDFLACKGAMEAAGLALDEAKKLADTAIKYAEATLAEVDKATGWIVDQEQKVLDHVSDLEAMGINAAKKLVEQGGAVAAAIIEKSEKTLNELKTGAEWVKYQTASAALAAAKAAASVAMLAAEAGITAYDAAYRVGLRTWQFVLSCFTSFVNITDVALTAELGKVVGGAAFKAEIKGTVGSNNTPFGPFHVEFDTRDTIKFIRAIFDKIVDLIENGLLDLVQDGEELLKTQDWVVE